MSEIENLKIGNGGTLHIVGNEDIIANEWEAGQVYIESRSYVIREHKLLMCNTTHTSVEPFDPDKWTEKNIGEALGTAGSANMIECTLAEYNAWKAGGQLINETVYIITDAPNLNETAKDISYDGGVTSTYDVIEKAMDYKSIYNQTTYQNDIGTAITTLSDNISNFRFLRVIVYISSISSSSRGIALVANLKQAFGANYIPICINGTQGYIRIETTAGKSFTLLALSSTLGNSCCVGEVIGIY